jgi:hypothetical protein
VTAVAVAVGEREKVRVVAVRGRRGPGARARRVPGRGGRAWGGGKRADKREREGLVARNIFIGPDGPRLFPTHGEMSVKLLPTRRCN